MNKLISIVVPVFNVEKYIEECLMSIAEQQYPNLEVILVDDCGTDKSIAIVEEFIAAKGLNWTILHHEQNKGLSGARNTGLKAAQGDYIFFLDSDDKIEANCISTLAAQLDNYKYDVVLGDYMVFGAEDTRQNHYIYNGDYQNSRSVLEAYTNGLWYVMAWNKLCRRNYLIENKLWFEEAVLHEDLIWSFKLANTANSLRSITECTYGYRIRPESIMTSFSIERDAKAYIKVFDILKEYVLSNGGQPSADEYTIIEGKKSTLLFSLLQKGEKDLFKELYPAMRSNILINPLSGFHKGTVSSKQLARDFHYCLPEWLGRTYKLLFYTLLYKWSHRSLEGAIWQ